MSSLRSTNMTSRSLRICIFSCSLDHVTSMTDILVRLEDSSIDDNNVEKQKGVE